MLVLEQRKETQLCEDVDRLKQDNQALLADLQRRKKEGELAKAVSAPATGQFTYAATLQSLTRYTVPPKQPKRCVHMMVSTV